MGEAMGATDHSLLVGQGIGAHCYVAYQYSFCHGWASGPTAWLSRVKPVEPGSARVVVSPEFGHLRWAEGSCPTPLGPIHLRHERQADVSIKSDIRAPDGVTVDLQDL